MAPLVLPTVVEDQDAELSNTGYTIGFVLEMMEKRSKKFAEAKGNSSVKRISANDISEGKGYISRVYRTVVNDESRKPYEFILKIPSFDSFEEVFVEMELDSCSIENWRTLFLNCHSRECDAYALITKVKDFPIPEIYHLEKPNGKSPGMITMESFVGITTTIGAIRSMTPELVISAAKHYAHLQAELNFIDGWKGKYPQIYHTSQTNQTEWPKLFAKFETYVPDALTFSHGDNWSNNVLIKVNDDGSVSNQILALIDWQIAAEGSPLLDLARFLSHNCDADIRREVEAKALDAYYEVLAKGYASRNASVPFTRQQATELYDIAYIQQSYEVIFFDIVIAGKDYENNPHLHAARTQQLHLRTKFVLDDAISLMEKYEIFEKFKR